MSRLLDDSDVSFMIRLLLSQAALLFVLFFLCKVVDDTPARIMPKASKKTGGVPAVGSPSSIPS
jgi:hypothetical protein